MLEKFTELTSIYKRQPDNKLKNIEDFVTI